MPMKHTIASVTQQARELASGRPITSNNYLGIATKIYGRDGIDKEVALIEITNKFTNKQFAAWIHETWLLPEVAELRRHCQQERPAPNSAADWLSLTVTAVLIWQRSAALLPLTRAFAARIEEENA